MFAHRKVVKGLRRHSVLSLLRYISVPLSGVPCPLKSLTGSYHLFVLCHVAYAIGTEILPTDSPSLLTMGPCFYSDFDLSYPWWQRASTKGIFLLNTLITLRPSPQSKASILPDIHPSIQLKLSIWTFVWFSFPFLLKNPWSTSPISFGILASPPGFPSYSMHVL